MEDLNRDERLRWEEEQVKRARRGDTGGFAELYRAYAGALFARVLLPRLGDRAAAEDALSETFRTAFERLDSFEHRGKSVYFWLARIGTNKALDMHRVKKTTGRALASFEGLLAPLGESPPDPAALLEDRAATVQLGKNVEAVLSDLNPRYRRAIELRFVEELTREQCAEALEVKLGTFDVLLLRALRAFRKGWSTITEEELDDAPGR